MPEHKSKTSGEIRAELEAAGVNLHTEAHRPALPKREDMLKEELAGVRERASSLSLEPRDREALTAACRQNPWLEEAHLSTMSVASVKDLQSLIAEYDWEPGNVFVLGDLAFAEQAHDEWLSMTRTPEGAWQEFESMSFGDMSASELSNTLAGLQNATPEERLDGNYAISSEKSSLATNEKEKSMAKEENVVPAEFAEEAAALSGENTASPTVQAPETAKAEWVNLSVKGAFLREAHDKKGNLFYDVSIPDGTKLGGAIDIGGYHFTASESRVHDSKYDPNGVTIGLVKDRPLQITKGIKQEDGTYRNVSREVRPENLRVALNNQYKDYKVTKAAERAAAKPDQAISQSPQASPAHDQKAAAKSASARAKSPAKAPVKKASL